MNFMKGMRRLAMVAGLVIAGAAPVGSAYADGWVRVVGVAYNDVLNVRAGPSSGYEIVGVLAPDATDIYVVGCSAGWCHVEAGNVNGWVSESFIASQ